MKIPTRTDQLGVRELQMPMRCSVCGHESIQHVNTGDSGDFDVDNVNWNDCYCKCGGKLVATQTLSDLITNGEE